MTFRTSGCNCSDSVSSSNDMKSLLNSCASYSLKSIQKQMVQLNWASSLVDPGGGGSGGRGVRGSRGGGYVPHIFDHIYINRCLFVCPLFAAMAPPLGFKYCPWVSNIAPGFQILPLGFKYCPWVSNIAHGFQILPLGFKYCPWVLNIAPGFQIGKVRHFAKFPSRQLS